MAEMWPDVGAVRAKARADWERNQRRRLSVQERIGQSVPWWLIVVAVVFFALSAPHTAGVFDRLTPGWGFVAPFGVEFGLLYAAFRRKQTRTAGERVPRGLWALEWLLFFTAVLVNGAGAFVAVVESAGLHDLSVTGLIAAFGGLNAPAQVSLMLVPAAALIIPIGTGVAGEGLAALLLERRRQGSLLESGWVEIGAQVEFEALRDAAVQAGQSPARAVAWAARIVGVSGGASVSVRTVERTERTSGRTAERTVERTPTRTGTDEAGSARARVRAWLDSNPADVVLSVRQLADKVGVGRTVANEVKNQWMAEQLPGGGEHVDE